jgi:Helix-turn-helix domain
VTTGDVIYDLAGVSGYMSLKVRTLRDYIHDPVDPLPAFRLDGVGKWLVRRSELDRWIARRRRGAQALDQLVYDVLHDLTKKPPTAPHSAPASIAAPRPR